jgi:cell division protein FtsW
MPRHTTFDKAFLGTVGLLVVTGFFVFSSASLSILANGTESVASIAFSQLLLGLGGGLVAFFVTMHVPYRVYRRVALFLFILSVICLFLVFIPGLGYAANGAQRWIAVFGVSIQPAELAKLGFIVFVAWYYSTYHKLLHRPRIALGGVGVALCAVGIPLLLQPDIGTLVILCAVACSMVLVGGLPLRYFVMMFAVLVVGLLVVAVSKPYVFERVTTFLHADTVDVRNEGYQVRQSLIAIGSGGWFGKGYGQGVQKFGYLPEATSDSVFSVAAEELGFFGGVWIIGLFTAFAACGLRIAMRARDRFGALLATGVVVLFVIQSFLNIGSMLGVLPLTGEPLVFMSHGGSSLFFALLATGVVVNISRYARARV